MAISPRWLHASAVANSTIYITGGTTVDAGREIVLAETLALDISKPWSVSNPPFVTLAPLARPLRGHSMNKMSGMPQIVVAGGESSGNDTSLSSTILIMDTSLSGGSWTAPTNITNTTFHRLYHASISTGKDGALLQGGYHTTSNGSIFSTLVTLNPQQNYAPMSTAPVSLAPHGPDLARHTMTLTTDGQAVILGGINSNGTVANLTIAHVLDTQAARGEWKVVPLNGTPPDPRMSFTAVLVNSTTMLVYGGTPDFKSAYWVAFYLDLPSWTWSSPAVQGKSPRRWGHTATMAGNTMIVAFGQTAHNTSETNNIALLDTTTNTWITEFQPRGTTSSVPDPAVKEQPSIGAVLGITFVVTVAIVVGLFLVLVRRRRRRTRNTVAREDSGDQTARSAVKRQETSESRGLNAASFLGVISKSKKGGVSKRGPQTSLDAHPISVVARMSQLGTPATNLGYPEVTVQQGSGMVPVSSYIYPNQPCSVKDKDEDGLETKVVYHTLSQAQQEALNSSQEDRANNELYHVE
ncbi:hypothetical protein MVEG_04799 [Podila verticillata NRRL 6337]|nr:hypothetical protein MVEG_04799 [Podila verticillata NRRL 6337]